VAAAERDPESAAGLLQGRKYHLDRRGRGLVFGQKDRGEKPPRRAAHDGDVVGVYIYGVLTDVLGDECYGVGLCEKVAVREVYDRRIMPTDGPTTTAAASGVLSGAFEELYRELAAGSGV
jgi:hypothetical protein